MAHLLLVVHGTLTMVVVEHFQIECITHLQITPFDIDSADLDSAGMSKETQELWK